MSFDFVSVLYHILSLVVRRAALVLPSATRGRSGLGGGCAGSVWIQNRSISQSAATCEKCMARLSPAFVMMAFQELVANVRELESGLHNNAKIPQSI